LELKDGLDSFVISLHAPKESRPKDPVSGSHM